MGGTPQVSPVVTTVANLLLAALWGLSVFAGWGLEAFCADGEIMERCRRRMAEVSLWSGAFAALAGVITMAALALPYARRDPGGYNRLMFAAIVCWTLAEGVLFVGGELARAW
ncbi:hypothetical protein [Bailinhaonella thermotolerans]|uniref:Uncharacterized protein n=1 Tax=Bailinhaonella thermotolerans TaxID=1070861 RepID=A0A3A4B492_9ACTN|nr:hypothetical protein [Bailinhaonella thermotolerans]RJL33137.1 hypothetical protein D5H75_09800 [Bailinhaonella thermotolerans]